jgi:hypothetical protein
MRAKIWSVVLTTALIGSTVLSSPARADVITFHDQTLWTAAVGSPSFFVNFESFTTDVPFDIVPLNVGPFTASVNGSSPFGNFIDTEFLFPPSFGGASMNMFVNGPLGAGLSGPVTVDFVFSNPVRAFFADFFAAGSPFVGNSPAMMNLLFADGTSADILIPLVVQCFQGVCSPPPEQDLQGFGFASSQAVTRLRFSNQANDGFHADNFRGVAAEVTASPEPTTFALLAFGLAGLGLVARARRRAIRVQR